MAKGKKKKSASADTATSVYAGEFTDIIVDVCEDQDKAAIAIAARQEDYELICEAVSERDFAHSTWREKGPRCECNRGIFERNSIVLVWGLIEE